MTLKARDLTGAGRFHHTVGDVDTLHLLASELPRNPVIVNIGACFGTSAMAMLEERRDAFIFSVDVNVCGREPKHIIQAELDPARVVRLLGRSQDIGTFWPHKVDMVFVDGAHGYNDVVRDIQAWILQVKDGGILAFHDYEKPVCPEVRPAIDDTMMRYGLEIVAHVESIIAFRI